MAAFRLGWEAGADGIECDVHMTRDMEVVCIHDFDTERVSGKSLSIADSSWEDLALLDVGSWKGDRWKGERIPLLRDALGSSPESLQWIVEIKCGPEIVGPLLEAIDASEHDASRIIVISFVDASIAELKRVRPELKAYWLSDLDEDGKGGFTPTVAQIVDTVNDLSADGFGGQSGKGITPELAGSLQSKGLDLNVWTVDEPGEARRMKSVGATSVTTNDPATIIEALRE